MLTVRFGQLTVEGLSPPKIRGLVGRSQDSLCNSQMTDHLVIPVFLVHEFRIGRGGDLTKHG